MMGPKALALSADCRAPAERMEGWPPWTQTRLHGIKKGDQDLLLFTECTGQHIDDQSSCI